MLETSYKPDLTGFKKHYSFSKSEQTIYNYSKYIRYFFNFFDDKPENISKKILNNYLRIIAESGKSPCNCASTIYSLKAYFKFLNITDYKHKLDLSVFEDLEMPRETFRVQKVVPYSDIKKIVRYLKKIKNKFIRTRCIMLLLIFATTGARKREVANIKLINVNLADGFIRFVKTKSNKPRVNPIPNITIKYIKRYLVLRDDIADIKNNNLLVSIKSKNCQYETLGIVQSLYNRIKKTFPNFTLHGIRRGYATDLYNNGVELAKVSKALGHANFNTTVRYYLLFKDRDLEKAVSLHPAYKTSKKRDL